MLPTTRMFRGLQLEPVVIVLLFEKILLLFLLLHCWYRLISLLFMMIVMYRF